MLHDATLDRTTSARGAIRQLRLEQLRGADAGRGERVPTLAEVLEHFPGVALIVEIKESGAARAAKRVVADQRAQDRVLMGAFEHSALAPFGPGWFRSASRRETAFFWAAARLRAPRWRGRYHAFTVPERSGRLYVVDQAFAALARRTNIPVHVWTVDDVEQGRRLRGLGVCGLITNFPGRLKAAGL